MRCCIGIDLAKNRHSAAVVREGGERLLAGFAFRNDGEGFASLLARLSEVGATCAESAVCLEATGHYGRNLVAFLEAHGYEVFEVNPLLTANWRKAISVRKVKNDAVDAEALALWLLAGNPAARRRSESEADDMRSLARSRYSLSHIVGDSKRKAHAIVDVVFPEFHGFFSDDFGKAGSAVLSRWGSAANVAAARVDSVERAIREASGGRFGRADTERLKSLARSSVGQHSAPLVFQLRQLVAQIGFTKGQMAELDAELERMLADSPIKTVPGVGPVCGAGILGEIGDIGRFGSASKLVAFAGCDPSVFESGEYEGSRAHLSKRGSPYLRWYLWLAADRARRFDPVLRDYYLKKRSEGKCHKVAVSAVVRKLCSIIFAVLRDGKPYVCPRA
ncbi:IS110 family transposase [Slackia heliotrinireducens]|uniref:IS110 family transposase n=1 Tax=Slackia heliotrinireducens TaxID=84110 RepID=UPI003315769B